MIHGMATSPPTVSTASQPPADSRPAAPAVAPSAAASREPLAVPGPSQPRTRRAVPRRRRANRCATCGKSFSSPGKLAQHQFTHTGERPFRCQRCEKSFSSKFKLMRHVLTHSKERQFQCGECSKGFYRKDHLKNHMETHNPNKVMFRCRRPACGKEYTSSTGLKKHEALHDAEDGNLMCTLCGVTFQAKDDIIFHLKTHAGSRTVKSAQDKKFQCDVCKKRFFTRKDVKRHLVVHTGSRDFVCDFCPQKFGRKDHLVRHVKKSHTDGPPGGAGARRGRIKPEPSAAPGTPGSPAAAAGSAQLADREGFPEAYYDEREGFRPPPAAYQPSLPDMDLPDPVLLPSFEPPDVLPDLSHTSSDLSAMLRPEAFGLAGDVFYPPHVRLLEPHSHLVDPFALQGVPRPPLATRVRPPPPPAADLSALLQQQAEPGPSAAPEAAAALAERARSRSPERYPAPHLPAYRYYEPPPP